MSIPISIHETAARNSRLLLFIAASAEHGEPVSIRAIARKARVDRKNFRQWRRGELPATSVMSRRIEASLRQQRQAGGGNEQQQNKSGSPHCIPPTCQPYSETGGTMYRGARKVELELTDPLMQLRIEAFRQYQEDAARSPAVSLYLNRRMTLTERTLEALGGMETLGGNAAHQVVFGSARLPIIAASRR